MLQKILTRVLLLLSLVVFFFIPLSTQADFYSGNSFTNKTSGETYTLRVYIEGKWYLITYNSDGYIINVAEDED